MAEQNIKMNVKTDTGYDTLYPQTKADIVGFNKSGSNLGATNVDSAIKEVNTKADKAQLTANDGVSKANNANANANNANANANKRIEKTKILGTLNEVNVATQKGFVPDALVVKELNSRISNNNKFLLFDEIDTGEIWFNGKKIYRRTYTSTLPIIPQRPATEFNFPFSLSVSDIWIDLQHSYMRPVSQPSAVYTFFGEGNCYTWVNTSGVRIGSTKEGYNEGWLKVITVLYTK